MLRSTGCDVDDMGVVGDDLDSIKGAVDAARRHDVILTIGGASVGDHDLVKPAFLACGATLDFIKVALKPGKPLMAGRLGNALVLEIGRASGRERVCQYGVELGGRRIIKKKKIQESY